MEVTGLVCFCGFGVIAVIVVPAYLMRKGLDFAFGCLGNIFVLMIAAILLIAYITIAEVDICQVWLVGDPICSFISNF